MYYHLAVSLPIGDIIISQWVPGHCGSLGTTLADGATSLARGTCPAIPIPFTTLDVNILVRRLGENVSNSLWNTPAYHDWRLYWPDPELNYRAPSHLCKRQESPFHRLHLEVAYTSAFRHRIDHAPA